TSEVGTRATMRPWDGLLDDHTESLVDPSVRGSRIVKIFLGPTTKGMTHWFLGWSI
ncbi:hypothetical protein HAX54_029088, partial [Datura stramonium]|nr:hypothetical protein [Datura stramonium]